MIRYDLKCDKGHSFDSWFKSAAAFDALAGAGHLSCAVCGTPAVSKALMAPGVSAKSADEAVPVPGKTESEAEKTLAALRRKVEENSDYVGSDFTRQARAMHLGDAPERSIYGEARPDQAKSLLEDGVPLVPLPFKPRQKLS